MVVLLITIFITPLFTPTPTPTSTISNDTAFNDGIVMSMIQLLESTNQCKIASIKYFNITRRLVDVDCVKALLEQQNITLQGGQ